MGEPLNYETPPPQKGRPFLPPGWTPADVVMMFALMLGSHLVDTYLSKFGGSWWVRYSIVTVAFGSVLMIWIAFRPKR